MMLINVDFCERLVTTLAHSLWQGLLIGIIFHIATTLLRSRGPEVRHTIDVVCLEILALCLPVTFLWTAPQHQLKFETIKLNTATGQVVVKLPLADQSAWRDVTSAPTSHAIRAFNEAVLSNFAVWHCYRWLYWD